MRLKIFLSLFILLVAGGILLSGNLVFGAGDPIGGGGQPLTGWAWSSNIGWISFSCQNQGVCNNSNYQVVWTTGNKLTGYAWSSNVGWIKFGGLSGCPGGSCDATISSGILTGWARAIVGAEASSAGWDGWIKLTGTAQNGSPYGVKINTNSDGSKSFWGFAWGDVVPGWISFSPGIAGHGISPPPEDVPCNPNIQVCSGTSDPSSTMTVSCSAQDAAGGQVFIINEPITWIGQIINGTSPFDYNWTGEASGSGTVGDIRRIESEEMVYPSAGLYTATLSITDANNKNATCTETIDVSDEEPAAGNGGYLEALDGQVEIRNQSSGQPANSIVNSTQPAARIKNPSVGLDAGPVNNISISITNRDGQDWNTVSGLQGIIPKCQLGGETSFSPCLTQNFGSIASGQTAGFRIQIPFRSKVVADNNPYVITLQGKHPDGTLAGKATVVFKYLVGTFDPF